MNDKVFSFNIQNGKSRLRAPFELNEEVLVSLHGNKITIVDTLGFDGYSEWIEIYSNEITEKLAQNQQGIGFIEIV